MANWIKKEIEGGNDGIAQVRSDASTRGVKLGDLKDDTPLLIDTDDLFQGWYPCKNVNGELFFTKDSTGKPVTENWIEAANVRNFDGGTTSTTKKYHIELDVTISEV